MTLSIRESKSHPAIAFQDLKQELTLAGRGPPAPALLTNGPKGRRDYKILRVRSDYSELLEINPRQKHALALSKQEDL